MRVRGGCLLSQFRYSWRVVYKGKSHRAFPRTSVSNTYLSETAGKKLEGGTFYPGKKWTFGPPLG